MHPACELTQLGPCRVESRADACQRLAPVRQQLRHMSEPPLGTVAELAFERLRCSSDAATIRRRDASTSPTRALTSA